MGLGGLEAGRAAGSGPLVLAAPVPAGGTLGASNSPKASCHSLLNSSAAPGPGLRRSLRKAMSPRSPSSSSGLSPVAARLSRPPPLGEGEREEGFCIKAEANASQLILKKTDVSEHQFVTERTKENKSRVSKGEV